MAALSGVLAVVACESDTSVAPPGGAIASNLVIPDPLPFVHHAFTLEGTLVAPVGLIAGGEGSVDGGATWFPMEAVDAEFDSSSESVSMRVGDAWPDAPTIGAPGTQELCIRGTDDSGVVGEPTCSTFDFEFSPACVVAMPTHSGAAWNLELAQHLTAWAMAAYDNVRPKEPVYDPSASDMRDDYMKAFDSPADKDCWKGIGQTGIQAGPQAESAGGWWKDDTQVFVVQNPTTGDIVVSFEGSQSLPDWIQDLTMIPSSWNYSGGTMTVMKGFVGAYENAEEALEGFLNDAIENVVDPGSTNVYFTGHSLGASLAIMAAIDQVGDLTDREFPKNNVVMYSVATPRTLGLIDAQFYELFVPNGWAINSMDDPVPNFNPPIFSQISNVAVLHSNLTGEYSLPKVSDATTDGTRLVFFDGASYGCGNMQGVRGLLANGRDAHDVGNYLKRLRAPMIGDHDGRASITASKGFMRISGSAPIRGFCDWVGLFDGEPTNVDDVISKQ